MNLLKNLFKPNSIPTNNELNTIPAREEISEKNEIKAEVKNNNETQNKRRRGRPKGSVDPESKHQQMLRKRLLKKEMENRLD